MNQKTSKALRKALGFKVGRPRKYRRINWSNGTHTFVSVEDRARYQAGKQEYLMEKRNGAGKPIRKRG